MKPVAYALCVVGSLLLAEAAWFIFCTWLSNSQTDVSTRGAFCAVWMIGAHILVVIVATGALLLFKPGE